LGNPVVSGEFLSAPAAFLWKRQDEIPIQLIGDCPQQILAYKMRRPTTETVCDVIGKLAPNIPKLIVRSSPKLCDSFSKHLKAIDVEHVVLTGSRAPERLRRAWPAFQTITVNVCLATEVALRGRQMARRILTIYPNTPTPEIVKRTSDRHILMLYQKKAEN
jgi:hypothetical protein